MAKLTIHKRHSAFSKNLNEGPLCERKKITPTTVQIRRLENIEHKSMKQVSYSDKYSFSACRAHQSHIQFSFVVRDIFYPSFLHV